MCPFAPRFNLTLALTTLLAACTAGEPDLGAILQDLNDIKIAVERK